MQNQNESRPRYDLREDGLGRRRALRAAGTDPDERVPVNVPSKENESCVQQSNL